MVTKETLTIQFPEEENTIDIRMKLFNKYDREKYYWEVSEKNLMNIVVETHSEEKKELIEYAENNRLSYKLYPFESSSRIVNGEEVAEYYVLNCSSGPLDTLDNYGTVITNECPCCKYGIDVEFVKLPVRRLIKYGAVMERPLLIVSKSIQKELQSLNVSGIEFMPIIDTGTNRISEDMVWIKILHKLPPTRNFRINTMECPQCSRKSVYIVGKYHYKRKDLKDRYDFYLSEERYFTTSTLTTALYPFQKLIVSNRAAEVFEKYAKEWGISRVTLM